MNLNAVGEAPTARFGVRSWGATCSSLPRGCAALHAARTARRSRPNSAVIHRVFGLDTSFEQCASALKLECRSGIENKTQVIPWRSVSGSQIQHSGTIRFSEAPGNRGTLVKVEMEYHPPAGVLGATIATVFGESPEKQIAVDLRRFKQLIETGEIARTEGQPAGRKRSTSLKYDELVRA